MENKLSVLICDDSALMRKLVKKIVEQDSRLVVVATAINGLFALKKIPVVKPDVIILDLEMPEMNGLEFLRERKRLGIDIPVIVLSSLVKKSAKVTFEALSLGASDFILKPSGSISQDIHVVGDNLRKLIYIYGLRHKGGLEEESEKNVGISFTEKLVVPTLKERPTMSFRRNMLEESIKKEEPAKPFEPAKKSFFLRPTENFVRPLAIRPRHQSIELVAIGVSTGGPNALRDIIPKFPKSFPVPILVVQHMPEGFTAEFANSLNSISEMHVEEAKDGSKILPGTVYIAPGNQHMSIKGGPSNSFISLNQDATVNGHRPSVDVLFSSVAEQFSAKTLAVIMTGMGKDGARELGTLYNKGAFTLAQDEKSCVVFGMPRVAIEAGYVEEVLSLDRMVEKIENLVESSRSII